MSDAIQEPVTIASRSVSGPILGTGGIALVALLAFGIGNVSGGIVLPLLRAEAPDPNAQDREAAAQAARRALLVGLDSQSIQAAPMRGADPVDTQLTVGQLASHYEARAGQSGLSTRVEVVKTGDLVELSFAFSEPGGDTLKSPPRAKAQESHPRALSLTLAAGTAPGSVKVQSARIDGREWPAGALFVELVMVNGQPPAMPEGMLLTPRGVFEIRQIAGGQAAFLDGAQVWPAPSAGTQDAVAPGGAGMVNAVAGPSGEALARAPAQLALQTAYPAQGMVRERMVMVASSGEPSGAASSCTARAIILDTRRGTVMELPEALQDAAVAVSLERDILTLSGFCAPAPAAPPPGPTQGGAAPPAAEAPPQVLRLDALYDLRSGAVSWRRIAAPPPVAQAPAADALSLAASAWRETAPDRIASPLGQAGALASISCRAGGGISVAVSGLPAPVSGAQSAEVTVSSAAGASKARMRWRVQSVSYDLDGRPQEARALAQRLAASGPVTISASGMSKTIPGAGRARVDRILERCGVGGQVAAAGAAAGAAGAALAARAAVRSAHGQARTEAKAKPKPKANAPARVAASAAPAAPPRPKPKPVKAAPTSAQTSTPAARAAARPAQRPAAPKTQAEGHVVPRQTAEARPRTTPQPER